MLTNKLLKCTKDSFGFTKGLYYQARIGGGGNCYVYDDNDDKRYSPFEDVGLNGFEIVDVNTNTESYKANGGVANYITSDLTKQIGDNIKVIIDNNFNGDMSNMKITETVKPVAIDTNGSDIVNITVTTELKIARVTLAEKRYNVIKKLYDKGDIVVVKCWDNASTVVREPNVLIKLGGFNEDYPYVTNLGWRYAYAVYLSGDEITEVSDEQYVSAT